MYEVYSSMTHLYASLCLYVYQVYGLFASTILRYKLISIRMQRCPPSDDPDFEAREWELLHHWASRRVYHLCVRLRGFWVKLGQYVSVNVNKCSTP